MATGSPEQPWPLRRLFTEFAGYVDRLGSVWVEGEISKVRRVQGSVFFTLRDTDGDVSADVTATLRIWSGLPREPKPGDRVTLLGQLRITRRTTVLLVAYQIRLLGIGDLLAEVERRRAMLRAEGLFEPSRKRDLPLIPQVVGVIAGRDSDALADVRKIAGARWPGVQFAVHEVPVQGAATVARVSAALRDLDCNDRVDVIIVTRGGGSVEDLLPFSDEGLARLVASLVTPVISAIGHESDRPILDDVADVRAATPTHAATLAVPAVADLLAEIQRLQDRLTSRVGNYVRHEQRWLLGLTQRPLMTDPRRLVSAHRQRLDLVVAGLHRTSETTVLSLAQDVAGLQSQLTTLSPLSTLERGYAIVTDPTGRLVRSNPRAGTTVTIHLAQSAFPAIAMDNEQHESG